MQASRSNGAIAESDQAKVGDRLFGPVWRPRLVFLRGLSPAFGVGFTRSLSGFAMTHEPLICISYGIRDAAGTVGRRISICLASLSDLSRL
jgi:hypothetical protein